MLGLLDARPDHRWRVDGTPRDFTFGDVKMRIAIQDELGRIDLNQADRSLLAGLFRSAGLDAEAAADFADKVLDWRSTGPGMQPSGIRASGFQIADLKYVPRNGPFQSVDELKLVKGITTDLYERVEPALTVYSGRQFIDPQFAPREALAALPGQSRDVAAVIVSHSRQGGRAGTIDPAIPLGGRAFGIRLQIALSDGGRTRDVVVRLTDQPHRPYWLLSWRNR